jgi:NADPH-dependent 2,4-dienoyl-CoA reductase/sulfur reductase-like enzyme
MTSPDVLVIGAGPAGLAAAIEASHQGARVMLVDEGARPGGQIFRQSPPGIKAPLVATAGETVRRRRLLARYDAARGAIDERFGTAVTAIYDGLKLLIADDASSRLITPKAVVLATGLSELTIPFPGWTLPGVVTAGALQTLLKADAIRAGHRIALAGTGPLLLAVAAQLVKAGADVRAVALLNSPWTALRDPLALWGARAVVRDGLSYLATLRRARVPVLTGWGPLAAEGGTTVERLALAPHDGDGRLDAERRKLFEVDTVGVNFGFTANAELARMAGVPVQFDARRGGWIPEREDDGATQVRGLYVAGDGAGLGGALAAEHDGRIAGAAAAAAFAGHPAKGSLAVAYRARARYWRFQAAIAPQFALPPAVWQWATDDTVICRCEGVRRARIARAIADGHLTLNAIKRNSRAGMGLCGGRVCLRSVLALSGHAADPAAGPMTARPGSEPVTLAALANRIEEA